ncbi:uncharacterized protein LOC126743882 [Anthonomus grandis grandis]|uniref:uncharacterized protein LOC126743882 n=1 Tax=Anthonomus grandis grandis TaxID=2921223 RepID=UPI002165C9C7|nr:uncharacterized protein LOC126743882 [Anthonomus grandis grandis]
MVFWIIVGYLLVQVSNIHSGYIEKVEVSACESCQLTLTCRQLDSIIAILDVNFERENSVENPFAPFPLDYPRDAVNKRCSGLSYCTFILTNDSFGGDTWGEGNLTIQYACATKDRVYPYCNSEIHINDNRTSGFIRNPGYPRFYAGQRRCRWRITAPPFSRILLRLLDVALFDTRVYNQEDCKDTLEIKDTEQVIYSTCTQEHPPSEVTSISESLEILLTSRKQVNPTRGILAHFSVLGCAPPLPPSTAYLLYENGSVAVYSCWNDLVFPDTQTKNRTIQCVDGSWNVSLPLLDCDEPELSNLIDLHTQGGLSKSRKMASELVAPIVMILILFALNAVVIFYIHKAKKKQIVEVTEEELGTFTSTKH